MNDTNDTEPIAEFKDAKVWYYESNAANEDLKTKHEGPVKIYPNWVRLGAVAIPTWIPRENVQQVHER